MKTADCEKLATYFFLQQQGWSNFILPISLLAGVFTYARLSRKVLTIASWTYIVLVVLVVYAVLTILSRLLIPTTAYHEFVQRCHRCQMDPYCGGPRELAVEDVLGYTGKQENFQEQTETEQEPEQEPELTQPASADNAVELVASTQEDETSTQAPEIETFTNFAPFDTAFPGGNFRPQTQDWSNPPMSKFDPTATHQPIPLTPGEYERAQSLQEGPTIVNMQWAAADDSASQGGFVPVPANNMCMMPEAPCTAKCSGDDKQNQQCDMMVAPIPGPTWQPQRAAVVQARLASGNYTQSNCPLN